MYYSRRNQGSVGRALVLIWTAIPKNTQGLGSKGKRMRKVETGLKGRESSVHVGPGQHYTEECSVELEISLARSARTVT